MVVSTACVDVIGTTVESVGGGEVTSTVEEIGGGEVTSGVKCTFCSNQASIVITFALIQAILVVAVFKYAVATIEDNNDADCRVDKRSCN